MVGARHGLVEVPYRQAPCKQRHTAHRIWVRARQDQGAVFAESTVPNYVRSSTADLILLSAGRCPKCVPDSAGPSQAAQARVRAVVEEVAARPHVV